MTPFIAFIFGMFIGSILGVVVMACMSAARYADEQAALLERIRKLESKHE